MNNKDNISIEDMLKSLKDEQNNLQGRDDNSADRGINNNDNNKGLANLFKVAGIAAAVIVLSVIGIKAYDGIFTDGKNILEKDTKMEDEKKTNAEKRNEKKSGYVPDSWWNKNDNNNSEIDTEKINSYINSNTSYTEYGIYVHNLKNDYKYCYNDKKGFSSSALSQIVILNTMSEIINRQKIDIDDEGWCFDYLPGNGKEGPDSKNQDGYVLEIKNYIEDIAAYGDNNKSNSMVDWIGYKTNCSNGFDTINYYLSKNNYHDTLIGRKIFLNSDLIDTFAPVNTTTPAEIADIYYNLIYKGYLGNETYMKNIFKSLDPEGKPLGIKKYIPSYYAVSNVNACNNNVDHDVMIVSDGETELLIVLMAETESEKTKIDTSKLRENAKAQIINYILENQFEAVDYE